MRTRYLCLLLLAACSGKPQTASSPPAGEDTDTSPGGLDTADDTPPEWVELAVGCEAPAPVAGAVTVLGEDQNTQTQPGEWFVELVDVELAPSGQVLWGAGQGGLMGYDVSSPEAPELIGYFPSEGPIGRFYRVEVISDEQLFVSHRDFGFGLADVSEPSAPTMFNWNPGAGMEGMALDGEVLYIADLFGGLFVFDVSDVTAPVLLDQLSWDGATWDLVVGDGVGYMADNTLGVVPLDLSVPSAPAPADAVGVGSGVQDLALGDGVLFAAAGGGGVVVLDLSDPLAPSELARLDYGGSVQSVALDGQTLWAVNQEDVLAIDVSDPASPLPLGSVTTAEFAMHVTARDGVAWVGDWSRLSSWTVDTAARQPDIELGVSELYFREEAEAVRVTVRNTGGGALTLLSAESGDARIGVRASSATLAPGEAGVLEVGFSGGADLLTALCLVSDDPDQPVSMIELHSGDAGQNPAIGEPAPDFALVGLDGETRRLSEQLGKPVVLAYFATW